MNSPVVVVDAFSTSYASKDGWLLVMSVGWNEDGDRLADDFIRSVAIEPFGAVIPARDDAVEILSDDRVIRGFEQLWNDAEGGHRRFWDAVTTLSGDPACDPVVRSVAARTASELPRVPGDAIELLAGLSARGDLKARAATALSHVVGALVVRFDDKQTVTLDPWCELAGRASERVGDTAWPLQADWHSEIQSLELRPELMPRAFPFVAGPSDAGRSRYDIFVTEHFASIP